jgi:hypothetical protein
LEVGAEGVTEEFKDAATLLATFGLLRGQLIRKDGTDVVRGKGDSVVPGMALLATDLAFAPSPRSSRLLGLDNVAGRRLGGVGGIP